MSELREAIRAYLEARGDHYGQKLSAEESGKRYVRIVGTLPGGARSAVAFIDQNGDILKPAGWKGPAKGVRGNVFEVARGLSLPPGTRGA